MEEIRLWLMPRTTRTEYEGFVCQAWLVWGARCRVVHDKENRELRPPSTSASSYLEDYRQDISKLSNLRAPTLIPSQAVWQPRLGDIFGKIWMLALMIRLIDVAKGACSETTSVATFGQTITKPDSIVLRELFAIKEGLTSPMIQVSPKVRVFSDSLFGSDLNYILMF